MPSTAKNRRRYSPPTRARPLSTGATIRLEALRTIPLPIEHSHGLQVATLASHHRDPFDRLLVAQAQVEDVPILTADFVFDSDGITAIRG